MQNRNGDELPKFMLSEHGNHTAAAVISHPSRFFVECANTDPTEIQRSVRLYPSNFSPLTGVP